MHCIYRLVLLAFGGAIEPPYFHVNADNTWSAVPKLPESNPASLTSIDALRLMDEALQRSHDGVIYLEIPASGQPSRLPIPPGFTVVREPEGGNVTLPCGDSCTGQPPQIRYNGHLLSTGSNGLGEASQRSYRCRCPVDPPDGFYDSGVGLVFQDPFMPTYFLHLYNFAGHLSGTYECLQMVNGELAVTNRYLISPRLLPNQVFVPAMKNATAKVGEWTEFRCAVTFNTMSSERQAFTARFMWRNEQGLIFAPGIATVEHDVSIRSEVNMTVSVNADNCLCHSTLRVESVRSQDAGRYQCWFMIDDIFDEWIVQSAYLHVV